MRASKITIAAVLFALLAPAAAWAAFKPIRVIAPELLGLHCAASGVCVEDPSSVSTAESLYTESVAFVSSTVSPLKGTPKVIFCSSETCARSFGLGARSALTVGTAGTVIGPHAWKPYYVRHELIHQLQGQQLGVVSLLFKPSWFVEGMAYSLSQDPRQPLAEPFESYRNRFSFWYQEIGANHLWSHAREL
ncbi:MAG: hypothetical protein LBQ09_09785 [Acidobacteriaceae bacterium]|jgi:hypothetical protein|nr:hypothetical protein [Acidobacteriaceae bacterium]